MAFQRGIEELIIGTCYKDGVPTAPVTNIAATISKDGAAFGATTNSVTPISGGRFSILLTSAEKTANSIHLVVVSDETDPEDIHIYTEAAYTAARATSIDTIAADVENIDGEAMRGTDNALLEADARIDTIAVDVAGLDGEAMRGTDNALLEADARIDTIATDVAGLDGAAMRGTNNALTTNDVRIDHINTNAALAAALALTDFKIDTSNLAQFQLVIYEKGTTTVLSRKNLLDINGDPVINLKTIIAGQEEA